MTLCILLQDGLLVVDLFPKYHLVGCPHNGMQAITKTDKRFPSYLLTFTKMVLKVHSIDVRTVWQFYLITILEGPPDKWSAECKGLLLDNTEQKNRTWTKDTKKQKHSVRVYGRIILRQTEIRKQSRKSFPKPLEQQKTAKIMLIVCINYF